MSIPRELTAVLVAGGLLAVGAKAHGEDKPASPPSVGAECFFSRAVSNWRAIDDERLIVWDAAGQTYLLTLVMPAHNLGYAERVAFEDRNGDGRICAWGGDLVIVPGTIKDRRQIKEVRRIDEAGIKALRESR